MSHSLSNADVDAEAKQVKRDLDGWREVLLPLHSILMWRNPADPGIIFGVVSVFFFLFWYLDPTILSAIAFVGLIATLVDFTVPTLSAQLSKPENWTRNKEKEFENISKNIAIQKLKLTAAVNCFINKRKEGSKVFYISAISTLFLLSWIGNVVDNLFLTYLTVCAVLLLPGVKEKGYLDPYLGKIFKMAAPMFCSKGNTKKLE